MIKETDTLKMPENAAVSPDALRIVVCVKQVPAGAQAKLDPVTKTLVRSQGASILNPYDAFAVEAALQLRDACQKGDAFVTALSMGIPSAEKLLRDLLSRGVDEGVLLTDRAFAGADTLATAGTLTAGIRELEASRGPVSLVICGHMAVDGDTAQIGPELAEMLHFPHVSNVLKIDGLDREKGTVTVECIAAEGRQTLEMKLPALITVSKDINVLRLPSIAGIRKADEETVHIMGAEDVHADPELVGKKGSATQVVRTFTPDFSVGAERITGTAKETAARVREIIGNVV